MSLFFRLSSDRTRGPVSLENHYAGTQPAACWLIGGGPSFDARAAEIIAATPAPRMCLNLAGTGLVRPTFWTSYDPSARFLTSVYLDPSILKFVKTSRAMDLVPETSFKVCDSPNLVFFEGDAQRGFADFLAPSHTGIVDWNDTFVQAIDILYRLGFRTLYLAGCEMQVRPSAAWIDAAAERGISYAPGDLLADFARACERGGLSRDDLQRLNTDRQYHFDETKPLPAAINTDRHYFRIVQSLRLCRRALSLAGMSLISVTPESRLNDWFPATTIEAAAGSILDATGDPARERTEGLYTHRRRRTAATQGPMRDVRPHHWKSGVEPNPRNDEPPPEEIRRRELDAYLREPPAIDVREEG